MSTIQHVKLFCPLFINNKLAAMLGRLELAKFVASDLIQEMSEDTKRKDMQLNLEEALDIGYELARVIRETPPLNAPRQLPSPDFERPHTSCAIEDGEHAGCVLILQDERIPRTIVLSTEYADEPTENPRRYQYVEKKGTTSYRSAE